MSVFDQIKGLAEAGEGHRELTQSDEDRLRAAGERLLAAGFGVESEDEEDDEDEDSDDGEDSEGEKKSSTHQSDVRDETPESVMRALVELSLKRWSRAVDLLTEKILDLETRLQDTEERAKEAAKEADACAVRAAAAEAKVAKLVRSIEISEASAKANALDLAKLRKEERKAEETTKKQTTEVKDDGAKDMVRDLTAATEEAKDLLVQVEVKVEELGKVASGLEEKILELRELRPHSREEEEILYSDDEGSGGAGDPEMDKGKGREGEEEIIWDEPEAPPVIKGPSVQQGPSTAAGGDSEEIIYWDD